MYMSKHKTYSSVEICKVAAMAREKGLTLLEGNYEGCSCYPDMGSEGCRGFCVSKPVAGEYLTLAGDGSVFQDYVYDGPYRNKTVCFDLSLAQAKERIMDFDGAIKNPPQFYAFIRVYDGEPEHYGYLQLLYLEEFARRYEITFADKFVCVGGQQDTNLHPEDSTGIDDVIDCCKKSFSRITATDFLVVSDVGRLNDDLATWNEIFNIISVSFEGMGYKQYSYQKSPECQKREQEYEKWEKDSKYEQMTQEHRKMMLQDDQPCIEGEGEYE